MSTASASGAPTSRWTPREAELLAVTLRLLQQHGFDRLTVEAVANEAKSSKATIYRRWPSKTELVVAAFVEGTRVQLVPPRTGALRTDLLRIGDLVCEHASRHASTMCAVMAEIQHSQAMNDAVQDEFVHQRKALIIEVLTEAVERGEIEAEAIHPQLWDLLPGYLLFRSLISGRPPDQDTVRALVDVVLMPSLTRRVSIPQ